jgi:rRNA-processing protein FCF1
MGRDTIKIIFDTNFLFIPIREKVDIFLDIKHEFEGNKEFLVLKESLEELKKLKNRGVTDVNLAVENVLKQEIKILDINGPKDVDDKIIWAALKHNAFIATIDRGLIQKAKSKGLKIIGYNKSKKRTMVI